MHIILAIVGILAIAAAWWWRLKMISEASNEVADVAGRAWGKWKRHKFRTKVEDSPIEAVNDPAAAAVVMMLAIAATEHERTPGADAAVEAEIKATMGIADATELLVFGKWVAGHVEDANNVSLRYAKLWQQSLNLEERRGLAAMVERIAAADGTPSARQQLQIAKLKERLGF